MVTISSIFTSLIEPKKCICMLLFPSIFYLVVPHSDPQEHCTSKYRRLIFEQLWYSLGAWMHNLKLSERHAGMWHCTSPSLPILAGYIMMSTLSPARQLVHLFPGCRPNPWQYMVTELYKQPLRCTNVNAQLSRTILLIDKVAGNLLALVASSIFTRQDSFLLLFLSCGSLWGPLHQGAGEPTGNPCSHVL